MDEYMSPQHAFRKLHKVGSWLTRRRKARVPGQTSMRMPGGWKASLLNMAGSLRLWSQWKGASGDWDFCLWG